MSFLSVYPTKLSDLQKRVAETSRNVISRTKQWRRLSTLPPSAAATTGEVVVTFGSNNSLEHIEWFERLLKERVPELVCKRQLHHTSGQYALYLSACYRDLLLGAEELGMKKPLAEEHGGGLREFSMEELDLFADAANEDATFLNSSERGSIVHHYLMQLCARDGDQWNDAISFDRGQRLISPLQSLGLIDQIFLVHQSNELKPLTTQWIRTRGFQQPLEAIRHYFGVQIALYFAWLGHYTYALIIPSIIGLLIWLFVDSEKYTIYPIAMACLSLIWTIVYLEHWKRTSAMLTYQWGMWDAPPALLEEPRVAFKGTYTPCSITGRIVRTYPPWRRNCIMGFFTWPLVVCSLALVILTTLGFVRLQEHVDEWALKVEKEEFDDSMWNSIMVHAPKVLLAVVIYLLDIGYRHLATWLTNVENHRLDSEYHNHLMGKLLLLQFMNSFYSLFYTAFHLQDMDLLKQQLTTLLITRQIVGNLREIFLPYGQSRVRQFILSFQYERHRCASSPTGATPQPEPTLVETLTDTQTMEEENGQTELRQRRSLNPIATREDAPDESFILPPEREATLPPYDGPDEDFLEMFIQFGYVSMFSCIFPVAGFLALLNNLVEIRGDAFKLTTSFQRPFAKPASNIGIWQLAMSSMGYAAVIVNLGLLSVSGAMNDILPKLTSAQSILLLVVIEHCIIITYYALSSLIPDTPSSVVQQVAKLEYRRREALRELERESMREYKRHRSGSRSDRSMTPPPRR